VHDGGAHAAAGTHRAADGYLSALTAAISVLLADDNLIVREGVAALLARDPGVMVVGVAADYDELLARADELVPQVVVTDIRMPPTHNDEGIRAAREVRRRHPGTAIVILSQYQSPDYALRLLADGAAGCAYLLKDRVADGALLSRAIRTVATGGSLIDPAVAQDLVSPTHAHGTLAPEQEALLREIAEGRTVKAIAAATDETPETVSDRIEDLFLTLGRSAGAGQADALARLRQLHAAIVSGAEQGERLSRLLPSGLAERLRTDRASLERAERLEVTVLMSDVRGYSTIAERVDPVLLADQLNEHRREMNAAILDERGTVMQYAGDSVMAVFGAPYPHPGHASAAVRAALSMHARQRELDGRWAERGSAPFGLGIGLSTGVVAAALLGSDERLEYTVVGDIVNLAQRLQDLARPAGTTVASAATARVATEFDWVPMGTRPVRGRDAPVEMFRLRGAA
jgi:adenylate cyclase